MAGNQVAILDKKTGEIEWSHPLNKGEDCNDVEITREGNILYAYTSGARMITRDQQTVWDFKAKKGEELFTATQLSSGHYMLAIAAPLPASSNSTRKSILSKRLSLTPASQVCTTSSARL